LIHLLWIPSWYPYEEEPFDGDFIQRRASAVSEFAKVTVLFAAESPKKGFQIEEKQINENLKEIFVYYPKTSFPFSPLRRFIKFFLFFWAFYLGWSKRIKGKSKIDLVQLCVIYPAGIFALWLHWFEKLPLIITEHWSGYRKESGHYRGWFKTSLAQQCVQKAKAIISVTEFSGKIMQSHGLQGKYYDIPNVVETKNIPKKQKKIDSKCRFIHVSTLSDHSKNISGLLNVIKLLTEQRTDFELELVGGAPIENRLYFEKKVAELGLQDVVHFIGMIPHKEVLKRLAKADVFVLFSNYEGLPCSMLEAMAVGLPVITTEIGDMFKWVNEERGKVISVKGEEELLKAMNFMIDNYTSFSEDRIRNFMHSKCSYPAIGKEFLNVYETVLKNN